MEKQFYEKQSNFSPILNIAKALIKERGHKDIFDIITNAKFSVVNTDYDGWNGGIYGYTVFLSLPIKQYTSFTSDRINEIEKIIADSLNEATRGDEHNYFNVQIRPTLSNEDIDWNAIGGLNGKVRLKQNLETIRSIMTSVATGGPQIKEEETRYKRLHKQIEQDCKKLNLIYNNTFLSLWDWYGKWKAYLPSYQERRVFIRDLFAPTLAYFDEDEINDNIDTFIKLDDWERIKRTVIKIKRDSNSAKDEEDFQRIGLLCRDVIISLAQAVYNPTKHGTEDEKGVIIGNTDVVRMIGNYISSELSGSSNEELRAYAKNTNKLANRLTHERNSTKKDMLLTVSSTIALINFIGIIDEKY
ncbi:MAG: hypothetical protein J5523_07630 [Muribaculaceae bacterium]|nr:hypothetical protein [Muribaculaceae bacterium]